MTLADSGWSQCFVETFLIKEAQCGRVYVLYTSSGDSRVVVSEGILDENVGDQGDLLESWVISVRKSSRRR